MARRKPGGAHGWLPWLVEVGLLEPVSQLSCLCCGGGEVAGVLAIIPSQASLSGVCKGIFVQLNLCWGQQDMPHGAGGSSVDTWECVNAVRLV